MSGKPIIIAGGGGAQALACARYVRAGAPDQTIIAIDRAFSPEARQILDAVGADQVELDIVSDQTRLLALFGSAVVVINLAGPFFRLGVTVLQSAIKAGVAYVDICDDVDATEHLLDLDSQARAAEVSAIVGMGSAPGTTNLLVKLALAYLGAPNGKGMADISWCAPDSDLTYGIFQHMVHCFRTALPDAVRVPEWSSLEPRAIQFPDPIGPVEVVRLGHPEPLTLKRFLGCEAVLRGGMTSSGLLHRCWELARAIDDGLGLEEAWSILQHEYSINHESPAGWSGMAIDVAHDDTGAGAQGLRFESATTISMEQSTAVPVAAVALMMAQGEGPPPGVWGPEVLDPKRFFEAAGAISPGGGGLRAYRLEDGQRGERIPMRALF
jgi:saccharopine dehydrogenase-like NADP-dependent oxidoreductase